MPAVQYPFIDIAVHARVRERFVRGDAIVLFSSDMARVLWANGAGARLFGNAVIYDFIEAGPRRGDILFRQLETTAHTLRDTGDIRRVLVRIVEGFRSMPVQGEVEKIRIHGGETAILFCAPLSAKPLTSEQSARAMIEGLDDPDTHMAVLDGAGGVVAASPGFQQMGIARDTAHMLVTMAGEHPDGVVKRHIPSSSGYLPAAIGKLSDHPPLHILFAVETAMAEAGPVPAPSPSPAVPTQIAEPDGIEDAPEAPPVMAIEPEVVAALPVEPSPVADAPDFDRTLDAIADIEELGDELESEEPEGIPEPGAEPTPEPVAEPEPEPAAVAVTEPAPPHSPEPALELPETEAVEGFVFNPASRASRFVWKIDSDGCFRDVSPELAAAVGPHAASINGVAFVDIAHLFNLDPEGRIAELLGKRDTWSGKTIYWPIEGTTLKVPVDLAALPTYTRDRIFDGFRGFGIVRPGDAIEDPMALGRTLGPSADIADVVEAAVPPQDEDRAPAAEPAIVDAPVPDKINADVVRADVEDESVTGDDIASEDGTEAEPAIEADDAVAPIAGLRGFADPLPADEQERPAGEPPALAISDNPGRRFSDKIVQLDDRRARGKDGLSTAEQAAFREIARQLDPFGTLRDDREPVEPSVAAAPPTAEIAPVEDEPADEPAAAELPFEGADAPVDSADADADPVLPEEERAQGDMFDPRDDDAAMADMLSDLIPPRGKMTKGLSPEAVDEMPVALLVHAGDTLIHANPEFLRLTGYGTIGEIEEVGGLDALLQRDDLEESGGRPHGLVLVCADDTLLPVTARLQSVRWEQTNALMLVLMPAGGRSTVERDMPPAGETPPDARQERLLAKLARQQDELEEMRSILETATDGVVIIGEDGEIRSINRSASALFNYDNQETEDKPFVMLFAHESQKAVLDYLSGLAGHGVASVLNDGREVIGREASGGFLPLFMTIGKLSASNGYCAVIRDITQWKRTEEELRSAKRAAETANAHKSDFLARVSHEIRTPLNAIIGFSEMMATERLGPIGHARYAEYANDIGRSGRHVLDIVNDLLDISKIEAGEMDLDFTSVGLNENIAEAVSLVQPQANSQRVIIRTALSQAVPKVVADQRSIKQIVLNVLSNAIRFTPSGGQIVVSTSYEANGSVVLRIRDTGVGMTRTELEQAMKPFRQVSSSGRNRGDGTGLGLPLTKAMVDANRASFSISSTPNEGTLVEIAFPSPRVLAN